MRTKLLTITALLALAATPRVLAQQASGQDDQSNAAAGRQTTSATSWTSSTPPEQAGDLYQVKTHDNGDFSASTTRDDPLPGALSPGAEPLGGDRQPDPKE